MWSFCHIIQSRSTISIVYIRHLSIAHANTNTHPVTSYNNIKCNVFKSTRLYIFICILTRLPKYGAILYTPAHNFTSDTSPAAGDHPDVLFGAWWAPRWWPMRWWYISAIKLPYFMSFYSLIHSSVKNGCQPSGLVFLSLYLLLL